jgi:hypothetical protein
MFGPRRFFGFPWAVHASIRRRRRLFDAGPFAQGFCQLLRGLNLAIHLIEENALDNLIELGSGFESQGL